MNKKSSDLNENNPFHIPNEDQLGKKQDKAYPNGTIDTLRNDMLPGSQISPSREHFFHRINSRIIFGILFAIIILSLIFYSITGFGRPKLEQSIIGLIGTENISLKATGLILLPTTTETAPQSLTPITSPTVKPTLSHEIVIVASTKVSTPTITATHRQSYTPTVSLSPTPSCWDVESITLEDVGKTLCVQGVIQEMIQKPSNLLVIFSKQKGAFYWISYDLIWSTGETNTCYQTTGKIDKIGENPVMVFDYSNIPVECP